MLTYITHGYIWVAWFKYVNTYQSLSLLTYIKHNLCWHTSPMGTIRMIYSSMLTCINHICYWSYKVCRLTSPMDMFELPELSTSTYIKHYLCWHTSHMGTIKMLYLCWLASPTYTLDLIKYADLHHPCIYKISWSMPTYITHGYIWIAWFKYILSMILVCVI